MTLYVFALNTPVSVTLTELTRAQGLTSGLLPLGAWLGPTAIGMHQIENIPMSDPANANALHGVML